MNNWIIVKVSFMQHYKTSFESMLVSRGVRLFSSANLRPSCRPRSSIWLVVAMWLTPIETQDPVTNRLLNYGPHSGYIFWEAHIKLDVKNEFILTNILMKFRNK